MAAMEFGVEDRTRHVRALALEQGFDRCAIAAVDELPAAARFHEWLADGMHGSMQWLERNAERRTNPAAVVPDAASVVVVAMNYHNDIDATEAPQEGRISRYAWGREYHDVLGSRIAALQDAIIAAYPGTNGLWYVDTGPVMEKAWAEHGGLGWIGKHTNVINRDLGSWIFLGALVLDLELAAGSKHGDYCGTCDACIVACPTDAIVAPYVLDARRCISYLTIENRGPIPRQFRAPTGNRIFGCDDCQDVCPWNRFAHEGANARAFAPDPGNDAPALLELLELSAEEFRERFRHSPVLRAKHRGFLRNVLVALGNSGDPTAVAAIERRLDDAEPLVRGHAAWALPRLAGPEAVDPLRTRLQTEDDVWVREELEAALEEATAGRRA